MVNRQDIEEFAHKIAEQFHPEKIILFGSYAYGNPTLDSDVDLMVIMDHDTRNVEMAIKISTAIRRPFSLDLFVRRPQDIETRIGMGDQFIREIIERGEVMYEAAYA
jgi:uncharacterized protein